MKFKKKHENYFQKNIDQIFFFNLNPKFPRGVSNPFMLKFTIIFFLLVILAFQQKIPPPAQLSVLNCHPDHPSNSVADFIITDNNYTSLISSHKFIMAIGSAGWCKACCKHEEFFYNLKQRYLINKNINPYVNKQKWINYKKLHSQAEEMKIARMDFSIPESSEINQQFKLLRVPYLIFFR